MDIKKATYSTLAMMGTLEMFKEKLLMERETIDEVKDILDNGNSLTMQSIAYGKLDIAKYLLENKAKVNVISKEGNNEFHCLAYHLKENGALNLAYTLLNRGVDLDQKDKKFNNSAFWYLCLNAQRCNSIPMVEFISKCLAKNPDMDTTNKFGNSVRWLIETSGILELQKLIRKEE